MAKLDFASEVLVRRPKRRFPWRLELLTKMEPQGVFSRMERIS